MKKQLLVFSFFCCAVLFSQTTIKGSVYDIYLEPLAYISVSTEKGSTVTDEDGNFTLVVKQTLPLKIKVSGVGYQGQTIEIVDFEEISVVLERKSKLQEVVISASRTPERILESPVSVERMGIVDIKNTSSINFYEGLVNLKGIDVLSNSVNVKNIVSNRGFANTENTRFVQLVDGIESTLPFINYSLGNGFGLNELDVSSVEILPGAASALYGPNALNGILLMNSKNPFKEQGISAYVKSGLTTQDVISQGSATSQGATSYGFYDVGVRMGRAFSDKFAAKVNFSYSQGEDWHATDYRNTTEQGGEIINGFSHADDSGYDGLNTYGDELRANLIDFGTIVSDIAAANLSAEDLRNNFPNIKISRVGFAEEDLIDYETKSLTFDSSLHYRPTGKDDFEIVAGVKYNLADNIIHGAQRYSQKGGLTEQYRLEFNMKNFFVKGYYTQNTANLVDPRLLGAYINNEFKGDVTYFTEFYGQFLGALGATGDFNSSLDIAREAVEQGKPVVGSDSFNEILARGKSTSVQDGGALFTDKSAFWHGDINYNFRDIIEFADFQIGGSYRDYELNSGGDIYSDGEEEISYKEFGIYAQLQKKFLDDHLKATLTGRFDKSANFDSNISPRASVTYAVGQNRNHNVRLSYQTGFRNPTTQDQYSNITIGERRRIIGTVEDNLSTVSDFYANIPGSDETNFSPTDTALENAPNGFTVTQGALKNNSYTTKSVRIFENLTKTDIDEGTSVADAIRAHKGVLEQAEFDFVKPETVQTLELGYRGDFTLANNLFEFDIAGYYNLYDNLITQKSIIVPFYGDVDYEGGTTENGDILSSLAVLHNDTAEYIIRTNTNAVVESYGLNLGFVTKVFGDFDFGINYGYSTFKDDGADVGFEPAYNTPEHVAKVRFGHDNVFKNFGFNVNARWQDEFYYQSVFINAIIEARTVLDAQVNYTIPSIKSTFKLGGTNLGGSNYTSVPGAGSVGSQYYLSWTINN